MNKEKIAVLVDTCCDAVSYTHLDVYKRQIWGFHFYLRKSFQKGKQKERGKCYEW